MRSVGDIIETHIRNIYSHNASLSVAFSCGFIARTILTVCDFESCRMEAPLPYYLCNNIVDFY